MQRLASKFMFSALGAGAGLAGLTAGSGACSGSCPSCLGCVAAGAGVVLAVVIGKRMKKKEVVDGLAQGCD